VNEHPVVRTHPITGRKALYVNSGFTVRIKKLTSRESDALLRLLFDHIAYGVRFQVRFHWEPNSVAIWDNRCVQHHASWDYFPETRHSYRVTTVGEAPFQ
jgi:alpha-ketoglutarate-dependent taurine dioxygenase